MKYKAKMTLRTVVMAAGKNVTVQVERGGTVDLDPAVADLVNHDVGAPVLTKAGTEKKPAAKTRQVKSAPGR